MPEMPTPAPILEAKALTKRFYTPRAQTVLDTVDLTVYPGDTVAISGRSGAGKSTLLQLLGTLDTACSGTVCIAGTEATRWNRASLRNAHVGFVFQSFYLLGDYTALDNALMPARIARHPIHAGSAAHSRATALLTQVGLSHRLDLDAKLLSGGEKQRTAIARALCNDPAVLFADEPTGNLDKQTAADIHELLLACTAAVGKALVVVTHDPALMALCQRRYLLESGKLIDLHCA